MLFFDDLETLHCKSNQVSVYIMQDYRFQLKLTGTFSHVMGIVTLNSSPSLNLVFIISPLALSQFLIEGCGDGLFLSNLDKSKIV